MSLVAEENALLERLLYKRSAQLRSMKILQGLKQIHRSLKRFFLLKIETPLSDFLQDLESAVVEEGIATHLPSKQTADYVVVHLLRFSAVLGNITSRCKSVFLHVHLHLSTGNLIGQNLIFLSLLSRIWVCCGTLLFDLSTLYSAFYPVRDILSPTNITWLPENDVLPCEISIPREREGHPKDSAVGDELALLLQNTSQAAADNLDEEGEGLLPLSGATTFRTAVDEDFGDPVSLSDVEMEGDGEHPGLQLPFVCDVNGKEKRRTRLSLTGNQQEQIDQLKERIEGASTIQDLQLLLKQFRPVLPHLADAKQRKCGATLSSLQLRSQVAKRKRNDARVKKLVIMGRTKLLKLLKSVKSKSPSGFSKVEKAAARSLPDKQKKGKKAKSEKHSNVGSISLARTRGKQQMTLETDSRKSPDVNKSNAKNQTKRQETLATQKFQSDNDIRREELEQASESRSVESLLSSQQLTKVLRTIKRKRQFKLKGKLFELTESLASEVLPDLLVIKREMDSVESTDAENVLLTRATKKLWRAVRSIPALRLQWKAVKKKSVVQ